MTAAELSDALAALPGVQPVIAAHAGIASSRVVGGVEVAVVTDAEERTLRRIWKERSGGGPMPLLVLADDPDHDSVVRALGPTTGGGPVRIVSATELLLVLQRLLSLPGLQAVRELAEELDRLDQTSVSGLRVRGLGTEHLFQTRLPRSPRWPRLAERAEGLPKEWRPLLEALGYSLDRRPARGYLLRHGDTRAAVVHPLADPAGFAKLDPEGRPPEGLLLEDCRREGVPYGLLASGGRIRLFEAAPESGSAVSRYLELDAAALTDDNRPLLGLLDLVLAI